MTVFADLRALDRIQRHTVAAAFLGWTLDAFDYFLLVMVMPAVAQASACRSRTSRSRCC